MRRFILAGLTGATLTLVAAQPGLAAATGTYADWSLSGSSGSWTAVGSPAAGFPNATVTSDAVTVSAPGGQSAFLGPQTPIGAVYASSQKRRYLNISPAASQAPSTTTVTFDAATPNQDWAFALGDVDADSVTISGTNSNGAAITANQLGFQSTFNYCAAAPKPSSCLGTGPYTDVPTWDPATRTLTGNTLDTSGASAWFEPTVRVKTLTFTFTRQVGFPIYQLWIAARSVPVDVPISGITPESDTTGVAIELNDSEGAPIKGPDQQPIMAKPARSGMVQFDGVVPGDYELAIVVPPSGTNLGETTFKISVSLDQDVILVPAGTFEVQLPLLPDTGLPLVPILVFGLGLLAVGAVVRTGAIAAPGRRGVHRVRG